MVDAMKLSVRQTIEALGIPRVVELSGMSRAAVLNWLAKDKVPHWQEERFARLAEHLPVKPTPKKRRAA